MVSFAETWPWALMVRDLDRALPLVEPAVETARAHPNTVTYRLERWAELSGWDARSFDGLLRSVIALRLAL